MFQQAIAFHQRGQFADAALLYRKIIAEDPRHAEALHLLGLIELQKKNAAAAVELIGRAIAVNPNNAAVHANHGIALRSLKRFDEALASFERALALEPDLTEALISRGNVLRNLKRFDEAIAAYDRALAIKPDYAEVLYNRGLALGDAMRLDEALASYDRALAVKPDYPDALVNRGNILRDLNRRDEALAGYDRALAIQPGHIEALYNRGLVLRTLMRFESALSSFDRALVGVPYRADVLRNRGLVLQDLMRFEEALASYGRALTYQPGDAEALMAQGNLLRELRRFQDALASYDRALEIRPNDAEILVNRGNVLRDLKRLKDALASYDRALAARPRYAGALINRGNVLRDLGRFDEALASFDSALAIDPDYEFLPGHRLFYKMSICDWRGMDDDLARLAEKIGAQQKAAMPFHVVATPLPAALQRKAAEIYAHKAPPNLVLPKFERPYEHSRIRLGYFSTDFRNHAVAHMVAELFERHDRSKFELIAFSFGPPASDLMRTRLEKSFDRFIEAGALSDKDVAMLARNSEIDIAIDLNGFTQGCRPDVFAMRAAPIQISYLGYPGTMGAEYFDYIIADSVVIPEDQVQHYAEKIVFLPDSYQANDSTCAIPDEPMTRAECGLPDQGFVFCCFNNNYKIAPAMFDVWMRLLKAADGSVLWLLEDNACAARNLKMEAQAR
ncbi:MAG TPA: tetratricopeptide repeat protein, partial [Micropepsaceae bacterium]|nr:tetratricopeptide repeat protein [Micropepsaceae bacterium]